jgi:hypothetical protein
MGSRSADAVSWRRFTCANHCCSINAFWQQLVVCTQSAGCSVQLSAELHVVHLACHSLIHSACLLLLCRTTVLVLDPQQQLQPLDMSSGTS